MLKKPLRILLFEDNVDDAFLIEMYIKRAGIESQITDVTIKEEYLQAIEREEFDLILCDHALPSFNSAEALKAARAKYPNIPFIVVSGKLTDTTSNVIFEQDIDAYLSKDALGGLAETIQKVLKSRNK